MRKISLECPTADLREYRKLAELAKELGATHLPPARSNQACGSGT